MRKRTKAVCEAAVMIAAALVLEMIVLYKPPNGGSVTLSPLPIIFFALRWERAGGLWPVSFLAD